MADNEPAPNTELATEHFTFERFDGELDAALVFAAAAEEALQNGKSEFGITCLSDASAGYTTVLRALPAANLTGAQLQDLKAKLLRLQHLLDGLPSPPLSSFSDGPPGDGQSQTPFRHAPNGFKFLD
jgi:hypothetical protein